MNIITKLDFLKKKTMSTKNKFINYDSSINEIKSEDKKNIFKEKT